MTVKVGSFCFPQSCTEILEGLVEDYPKRAWLPANVTVSVLDTEQIANAEKITRQLRTAKIRES